MDLAECNHTGGRSCATRSTRTESPAFPRTSTCIRTHHAIARLARSWTLCTIAVSAGPSKTSHSTLPPGPRQSI
eukprot:scaffold2910_cov390-Prasinococcus_capsulatus_cf.AAC.14